jgi:hypothetical protein
LSYDLLDLGFGVKIDYSSTTMFEWDESPKIEVNIIGEYTLFDENNNDVVLQTIESIKRYVSGFGFSTVSHLSDTSTSNRHAYHQSSKYMTYKLSIQKE